MINLTTKRARRERPGTTKQLNGPSTTKPSTSPSTTKPLSRPATTEQSDERPLARTVWAGRVPHLKPGRYDDGLPFHQVNYLSCKLILRPNPFTSRQSLFDFSEVLKGPAKEYGVGVETKEFRIGPLKIREVLFRDTKDFRLYNNAFILRRRISYTDGFPDSEPEIVFKFRHADIQKAAETDVRPHIIGEHRVKFKCQALPLKEKLGGIRMLFSHNVQFPLSREGQGDKLSMEYISTVFPVLERIKKSPDERFELVNDTIIEEVLQDIAMLDFGQGVTAKTDVAIWRTRGEHRPLIGEFAFQIKFQDRKELCRKAMERAERFFVALQYAAKGYIALNATKTGTVYRLLGNPPKAHE